MDTPLRLPALTHDTTAFWTGGQEGKLRICYCQACARYQHPPLPVCPQCGSDAVDYPAVSGAGSVVTYSVNWQSWTAGQKVPFVLAIVELAEQTGLWLMTNIVDCPVDSVRIGMPVNVAFINEDDVWLPVFRPGETP